MTPRSSTGTLPSSISVLNYRSFSGAHEFELKPLTLIYGGNNVGKSALLRFFPLLGDSVASDATGALRLDGPAALGAGFDDLETKVAPNSSSDPTALGFGLKWATGPIASVDFEFERRDREGVVIREFRVTLKGGHAHQFTRVPRRALGDVFRHEYDLHTPAGPRRIAVSFRGLIPSEFSDDVPLAELRDALLALRGSVQWLRAQRALPGRRFAKPSGPLQVLVPDGSNAPGALWSDPSLAEAVSRWFQRALGRAMILTEDPPDEFRCALENALHADGLQIDLIDSGNGPSQVLPVIVACALAARASRPRIVAIEESDANLDVSTQQLLAEYLVETAAAASRPRLIIETHSEALLLGVQLAIAKGDRGLTPDDVAIYWVEQDEFNHSRLSRVSLDKNGRLHGNWPDPFGQLRALARELVGLRLQRSGE